MQYESMNIGYVSLVQVNINTKLISKLLINFILFYLDHMKTALLQGYINKTELILDNLLASFCGNCKRIIQD